MPNPGSTDPNRPLTVMERRFVDEYLIDGNGADAYRRAGYKCKNGNVARVLACRLLQKPNIAAAIEAGRAKVSEATGVTAQAVVSRLWAIATADPHALMQLRRVKCTECGGSGGGKVQCPVCAGDGTVPIAWFEDTRNLGPSERALFAGVKVTEHGIEVKTKDQMRALELLGKHLGIFTEKVELNMSAALVERLLRGRARARDPKPD